MPRAQGSHNKRRPTYKKDQIKRLLKADESLCDMEIAEEVGCTLTYVRQTAWELDIKLASRCNRRTIVRHWTPKPLGPF